MSMVQERTAIVTGASRGLGKELVRLLVRDTGVQRVWAIARSELRLRELRSELGEKIEIFPADLTERSAVDRLSVALQERQPQIVYLVNDAGFGKFGPSRGVAVGDVWDMVALNAGALTAMTQVCLPYIGQGGCIMNVCSIAAFHPLPYMNVYSATKVFALHYSLALRRELRQAGVNVTAVCPGWMDTAFLDRAREGVGHMVTRYAGITTPERVARKALRDARRGRSRSLCGVFSHLTFWASRLLPRSLVTRLWLMQQHLS